nr:PAS domain-containing sensor histidine kinase [Ramlibacter albus]
MRLLVRSTHAGFGDWDAVRDVVTYCSRFKEMLGYPPDEDTSGWPSIFEMMHPDDRDRARDEFRAMIRRKPTGGEQSPGAMSYRLRRRDGSYIWIHAEGIAQVDETGRTRRFITSYLDVTRLYEQEEQLRRSRDELAQAQAQLMATARRAGKAEVATNVLHNVGNVLNSVIVSASTVRSTLTGSRLDGLARVVELLQPHESDLAGFFADAQRGATLVRYLRELEAALRREQGDALADIERVLRSVDHISHVVAMQQSHAGPSSLVEHAQPLDLLNEALRLSAHTLQRWGATTVLECEGGPAADLDKPRLLQILVNLISNGARAMRQLPEGTRRLTLSSTIVRDGAQGGSRLRIAVTDVGEGIAPAKLRDIFAHGYTTHAEGHGFGLHSSAVAAIEMGGKLTAHSEGPGRGATFTLDIPVRTHPAAPVPEFPF